MWHLLESKSIRIANGRCVSLQILEQQLVVEVLELKNINQSHEFANDPKKDTNRCIMMRLSDGKREVKAFEYSRCMALSIATPVGTKVCGRSHHVVFFWIDVGWFRESSKVSKFLQINIDVHVMMRVSSGKREVKVFYLE